MTGGHSRHIVQLLATAVAILFGLATVVAGGRVLLGPDPGYLVYRPLLIYNTLMGVAYIAAGYAIWRSIRQGAHAAQAILLLNVLVLAGIVYLYRNGDAVAIDSVRAMTLRSAVWLSLFLAVAWRRRGSATPPSLDAES